MHLLVHFKKSFSDRLNLTSAVVVLLLVSGLGFIKSSLEVFELLSVLLLLVILHLGDTGELLISSLVGLNIHVIEFSVLGITECLSLSDFLLHLVCEIILGF